MMVLRLLLFGLTAVSDRALAFTFRFPDVKASTVARTTKVLLSVRSDDRPSFSESASLEDKENHEEEEEEEKGPGRRRFLRAALEGGASLPLVTILSKPEQARAAATASPPSATTGDLVADVPMIRLKLPKGGFGREYVAIKIKVDGQGPFEFMVDTGLTTEFITPHLQEIIKDSVVTDKSSTVQGIAAGGTTGNTQLVELKNAALCCGTIPGGADQVALPTLHAVITDFPQEHMDPAHDPVEGMLGMEMLSQFDVDFDFPAGRLRLYKPGTARTSSSAAAQNLVEIPAVVINETGLIGIRLCSARAPGQKQQPQPVLGFLDCGSSFSAVNWQAARYLGLPTSRDDAAFQKGPSITALGIDGRPLQLPTIKKDFSFVGDVVKDPQSGRPVGFSPPPQNWKPWDPIRLAVGDLPAFESTLGDGVQPYKGPAALIGLDILAQRRVILETGPPGTRRRRVYVSAA